jgi:hypothetical protein
VTCRARTPACPCAICTSSRLTAAWRDALVFRMTYGWPQAQRPVRAGLTYDRASGTWRLVETREGTS